LEKKELLYEGKAKKLYLTDNEDQVIQEFKDDVISPEAKKKRKIKGKGAANCQASAFLFKYLESYHVPNHYIETISDNEMLVKKVEIIPIEVVMRNIAAGSLTKRYGIEEGKVLEYPVLEHYLKDDENHDPFINEYHAYAFNHATPDEIKTIGRISSKVNAILKSFFQRRGITLVDFKVEFGRFREKIILADEISLDTCRLWDAETNVKLDKERFLEEPGNAVALYQEILKRIIE